MNQWKSKDWEEFLPKLKKLNRDQLATLAQKTEVIFDEPETVSKEEFLLALDETDPEELKKEYEKITTN